MLNNPPPPIRVRTNMNALAFFGPHLATEKDGKSTIKFKLPDSLTRYRIMALANTIDQFGTGESTLVVCLPLMLRQAPPRFLNYGDSCTLPVVVQNETDEEREVMVGIKSVGEEMEVHNPGWKFKIAPRGRYKSKLWNKNEIIKIIYRTSVPFQVKPKGTGSASFQVAVSDAKQTTTSDAVHFHFPVHAPTTTEVFAESGILDGDNVVQQPIAKFRDDSVVSSVGGMEVSLASTVFQELTDAALYLFSFIFIFIFSSIII